MRHDDSSKRPRVDPAQNPRLAAALSRLSQGLHESKETPSQRSEGAPPGSAPIAPGAGAAASGGDLYVPGDDDVELIDQDDQDVEEVAEGGDEEEIIPSDAEMQLIDLPPNNAPRLDSFGSSIGEDEEEMTPADGEMQLFDGSPYDAANDPSGLGEGALFDADGNPIEGAMSGELIVEPWADRPAEARVSLPPSIPPGARSRRLPRPVEPVEEPESAESDAAPESSPWATEAGVGAIDASALPSAHSPVAVDPKPAAKPLPAAAEASGGSRSWVTLFLVIALVASGTTFLVLRFNVGQKPQDVPGAGPPIQVSAPTVVQPPVAPVTAAAPEVPTAAVEPLDTAPSADAAVVAPPDPSAAVSAEPTADPVVPVPSASVVTTPVGPYTGPPKVPTGPKPGGTPTQSSKKPSRIF